MDIFSKFFPVPQREFFSIRGGYLSLPLTLPLPLPSLKFFSHPGREFLSNQAGFEDSTTRAAPWGRHELCHEIFGGRESPGGGRVEIRRDGTFPPAKQRDPLLTSGHQDHQEAGAKGAGEP